MNREIKFRAYNKEFKMMSEAFTLDDALCGTTNGANFKGSELMQYTGLKDKNGKEIYEGDIVRNKSLGMKGEVMFGELRTNLGNYQCYFIYRKLKIGKDKKETLNYPHWEVIGNIYENPELLT